MQSVKIYQASNGMCCATLAIAITTAFFAKSLRELRKCVKYQPTNLVSVVGTQCHRLPSSLQMCVCLQRSQLHFSLPEYPAEFPFELVITA